MCQKSMCQNVKGKKLEYVLNRSDYNKTTVFECIRFGLVVSRKIKISRLIKYL